MDKEGIAWGVLLSLAAQGLYDVLSYWLSGKIVDEWVAAFAVSLSLLFVIVSFSITGVFKGRKQTKQHQASESEQQASKWRRLKEWLKKTENVALIFSLVALIFTGLIVIHELYPPPPPVARAKLTIFIEHYNFYTGTSNELNYDIWGRIVNDSPLSALVRRWGLVLCVNMSYTIFTSRFYMPKLSLAPSEQANFTMGHVLAGDNGTSIPETAVKGSMAWIEYEDDVGMQIAQKEFNFVQ